MGGGGDDNLINVGSHGTMLRFTAGEGNDAFTNSGNAVQLLEFTATRGMIVTRTTATIFRTCCSIGGTGNDALQQNGQRLANLVFYGEEDEDTLLIHGSTAQRRL